MKNVVTNYDPHKFSVNEIFANNNGKTSSTKVVGFLTSVVCLLLFIMLVIYFFVNPAAAAPILEFIDRTVTYFSVAAGLMGVKSITSAFGRHKIQVASMDEDEDDTDDDRHRPKRKRAKQLENDGEEIDVVEDEENETPESLTIEDN